MGTLPSGRVWEEAAPLEAAPCLEQTGQAGEPRSQSGDTPPKSNRNVEPSGLLASIANSTIGALLYRAPVLLQ